MKNKDYYSNEVANEMSPYVMGTCVIGILIAIFMLFSKTNEKRIDRIEKIKSGEIVLDSSRIGFVSKASIFGNDRSGDDQSEKKIFLPTGGGGGYTITIFKVEGHRYAFGGRGMAFHLESCQCKRK